MPGGQDAPSARGDQYTGMWPSGKAWDFGPHKRWFDSSHPCHERIMLSFQMMGHDGCVAALPSESVQVKILLYMG